MNQESPEKPASKPQAAVLPPQKVAPGDSDVSGALERKTSL
jgi:hypothetical protein